MRARLVIAFGGVGQNLLAVHARLDFVLRKCILNIGRMRQGCHLTGIELIKLLEEREVDIINELGVDEITVRSPVTCEARSRCHISRTGPG